MREQNGTEKREGEIIQKGNAVLSRSPICYRLSAVCLLKPFSIYTSFLIQPSCPALLLQLYPFLYFFLYNLSFSNRGLLFHIFVLCSNDQLFLFTDYQNVLISSNHTGRNFDQRRAAKKWNNQVW